MGYPFDSNPLNSYLPKFRDLIFNIVRLDSVAYDDKLPEHQRDKARAEREAAADALRALKKSCTLKSRDFDIFLCKPELAVIEYDANHSEPYNPFDCKHPDTDHRTRTYSNGHQHIVAQCLICGNELHAVAKNKIPDWQNLAPFDESLGQAAKATYSTWADGRIKARLDALVEGDELPAFDRNEFRRIYEFTDPEPKFSGKCDHVNTQLTRRSYNKSGDAAVIQCVECGHHVKSTKKPPKPEFEQLPAFDEELKPALQEIRSQWLKECWEAEKAAHDEFHKKLRKRPQIDTCYPARA